MAIGDVSVAVMVISGQAWAWPVGSNRNE